MCWLGGRPSRRRHALKPFTTTRINLRRWFWLIMLKIAFFREPRKRETDLFSLAKWPGRTGDITHFASRLAAATLDTGTLSHYVAANT